MKTSTGKSNRLSAVVVFGLLACILGLVEAPRSAVADEVPSWLRVVEWHLAHRQNNRALGIAERHATHSKDSLAHAYCGFIKMYMGYPKLGEQNLARACELRPDGFVENSAMASLFAYKEDRKSLKMFMRRAMAAMAASESRSGEEPSELDHLWARRVAAINGKQVAGGPNDLVSALLLRWAQKKGESNVGRMSGVWPIVSADVGIVARCEFLVDTGCDLTIVDSKLSPLLFNITDVGAVQVHYLNTLVPAAGIVAPEIWISGEPLPRIESIHMMGLDTFRASSGTSFGGVLGMDSLRSLRVVIDYDKSQVAILKTEPKQEEWDHVIPLVLEGKTCSAFLVVDGKQEEFTIDTGCELSGTINRSGVDRTWRIPIEIQLDGKKIPHVLMEASSDGVQLLGAGFLSRFLVCFDFPSKKLLLARGKNYAARDSSDSYGMRLREVENGLVVTKVKKDSPAERLGAAVGDTIITPANSTVNQLLRRLTRLGPKTIHLRSGSRERQLSLN